MPPQRPGFNDPPDTGLQLPGIRRPGGRPGFNDEAPAAPDPLALTFDQARKTTADAAAHLFDLRLKTGIPSATIARNLDQVERQVARDTFDPINFRQFNPALAAWIEQHPDHAAIAQDDLGPLAVIGRVLSIGANSVRSTGAGVQQLVTVPFWAAGQYAAAATGATGWEKYFASLKEQATNIAATVRGPQTGAGPLEKDFYSGFESMGQSLPITLATGAANLEATAAAKIATALMSINVGLTETGRALDAGTTPLQALSFGTFQAEVEYVTEFTPALWFMKDLKANPGFLKMLAHQMASEVPGEQVATLFQDLAEWATLHPEAPFTDYLAARPSAAVSTLVATITMVGAQSALVKAIDVATRSTLSERQLEALHTAATESTTREAAPVAFNDYVALAAKGGLASVGVDVAPFTEYMQEKGEDPATVAAALTGDPDAYQRALDAENGELTIPTQNYLSQMTGAGHEAFFKQELRLGDAPNARELKADVATEATADAQLADQVATLEAREEIYAREYAALMATGRYSQRDAETTAGLTAHIFSTIPTREGLDIVGNYEASKGGLVAPGSPVAATPRTEQAVAGIPASTARPGETGDQRRARSAGHLAALTQHVVRQALAVDPTADAEAVARAFQMRYELHAEGQQAAIESGQDPGAFLRFVATWGGLDPQPRSGMFQGELDTLAAGADTRRGRRGRPRGATTWKGVKGVFVPGSQKTLDGLREALVEAKLLDPDATINDVIDRLTTALSAGSVAGTAADPNRFPGTDDLAALDVDLATKWWDGAEDEAEVAALAEALEGLDEALGDESGPEYEQRPFDEVAPHLTADEIDTLATKTARDLLRIFKALPSDRDYRAAALAGSAKRGWYTQAVAAIRHLVGLQDAPRFAALLAAMSPQNSVPDNLRSTARMWTLWEAAGRPTAPKAIRALLAKSVRGSGTEKSVLESWVKNSVRALSTRDTNRIVLSGPKVNSFMLNLLGVANEVTNDTWMAAFAAVSQTLFRGKGNAAGTRPGKRKGYLAVNAKIRRVATALTAETGDVWTPAEVQETVWTWARTIYLLAKKQGTTAEALVRAGAITDAEITEAPDFATLLTQDASIRDILESAGYGKELTAIERELRNDQGRRRRAAGAAAGIGAGAGTAAARASRSVTLGNLRNARRLDALRKARLAAKADKADTEYKQDDGEGPDTPVVHAPFYSRLQRAVEASPQAKATGAQWKATIRNAKIGINQDEFALTKVEDLNNATTYTKQEVLDYLRAHRVEVRQVLLGESDAANAERIQDRAYEIYDRMVDQAVDDAMRNEEFGEAEAREEVEEDDDGEHVGGWTALIDGEVVSAVGQFDTEAEAQAAAEDELQEREDKRQNELHDEIADSDDISFRDAEAQAREELGEGDSATHYQEYSVAGPIEEGSYREAFVVAPSSGPWPGFDVLTPTDNDRLREAYPSQVQQLKTAVDHAAFVRLVDAWIDWQTNVLDDARARGKHYTAGELDAMRRDLVILEKLRHTTTVPTFHEYAGWSDGHDEYRDIENPIVRIRLNIRVTPDNQRVLFLEEVQPPGPENQKKMPALFVKNWRPIGFKWALRYAAEQHVDAIAWTTGAQQADRYSLRKQVDRIAYYPESKQLAASKGGRELLREYNVTPDALVDYIGKAAADKLLATPAERPVPEVRRVTGSAPVMWAVFVDGVHYAGSLFDSREKAERAQDQSTLPLRHALVGEDLEIGGEGLKRLYDVDFANVVKSLPAVKKHGGKVGTVQIQIGEKGVAPYVGPTATREQIEDLDAPPGITDEDRVFFDQEVTDVANAMAGGMPFQAAMQRYASMWVVGALGGRWGNPVYTPHTSTQPALPLTPALTAAVLEGQALFQGDDWTSGTNVPGSSDARAAGPGALGSYNPVTHLIKLLKGANRTTYFHENAHLILDMLRRLAAEPGASASLQADMGTLLTFFEFEGDLAAWNALTHEERRTHHETFARAFEAYLMEGKAPTAELQPLFSRVRIMFLRVYKTLRRLHVELTPEVRAVMDRLVASDAAIAEAQGELHVAQLFATAEDADMSDVEFAGYQAAVLADSAQAQARLAARVLADWKRAEEAWWKEERVGVRAEVAAEVAAQPVYRALAGMRGTLEGSPATPLSKDALVAEYGAEVLATLPLPYVYSVTSGLPADTVAELYGFRGGGGELLDAIRAARPMEDVIESDTDERMERDHRDIFRDPTAMEEAARQAVTDTHRDTVIRLELAALRKLRAAAAPSVRAAKQDARDTRRAGATRVLRTEMPDPAVLQRTADAQIAGMHLEHIRPERFWAAARRGSRAAVQAAAKGDFDAAVAGRQQELTNLALFRAATAAREAVDETRDRWQKTLFAGAEADVAKRRDWNFVQAARAIAAQYFFPEKRLAKAREGLDLIKEHDPDLYQILTAQIADVQAGGTTLPELTYQAFLEMRGVVEALWEQSLRQRKIRIDGQLVDRDVATHAMEDRLTELGTVSTQYERTDSTLTTIALSLRALTRRTEFWVRYMDGGDPQGAFRRYLWTPVSEAVDRYRVARDAYRQKFLDIMLPIADTLVPGTIAADELAPRFAFASKAALLHAISHTGNPSNYQKLLRGRKWGEYDERGELDDSKWLTFMARMYATGIVTQADMDTIQKLWRLNDELKAQSQAVHRELFGFYFNEITEWTVTTPWGTMRGGYMPAVVDPNLAADAETRAAERANTEGANNSFMFPTAGRGWSKARVEGYAKPLELDLATYARHLDQVLRFVHIEPHVRDVARLLKTYSLKERLAAYDPKVVGGMLLPYLQRAASQRISQPGITKEVDTFWRAVRTRTGLNLMVGNIVNTAQQLTGLFPAKVYVRRGYLRNALWRYLHSRREMIDFAHESSDFMRTLMSSQVMEIQRNLDDLLLNPSTFEQAQQLMNRHGYFMQSALQNIVNTVVWHGAYDQASAEVGHDEAVRQANSAVRMSQGSHAPEDAARFEVQTPFVRTFFMFSGWVNTMANLNANELAMIKRDAGLVKGAPEMFRVYVYGFAATAVVGELIVQAAAGFDGWDPDDDEWYLDDALSMFFWSQARLLSSFVPGAGPAALATVNHFNDKPYDDRIVNSPIATVAEGASRAPLDVWKLATGQDVKSKQVVRDVLDLLGLFSRVPVGALKKPAGYIADVVDENQTPEGVLDWGRGLVTGRGPEQ